MSRHNAAHEPALAPTKNTPNLPAASVDAELPRLALRVEEAAAALGMSNDSFRRYVASEVSWVRRGSMKLVRVAELERWLTENEARTLP